MESTVTGKVDDALFDLKQSCSGSDAEEPEVEELKIVEEVPAPKKTPTAEMPDPLDWPSV